MIQLSPDLPVEKLPEAAGNLLDKGVLGTFVFILTVALFFAIKGWLKTKDDRLQDQKDAVAALLKVNDKTSEVITESIRADDAMKVALDNITEKFERLEIEVRSKRVG
jgi:hypothetical protein